MLFCFFVDFTTINGRHFNAISEPAFTFFLAMKQTNYQHALNSIWALTKGKLEVCVAVIDGPADLMHPSLDGANINQTSIYGAADQDLTASDHGTHVCSIIFGQHHSAIKGIAPHVKGVIIPIFEINAEKNIRLATQLDLARAINKAIEQGADIINISAGELDNSGEPEEMLAQVLRQCEENNILVIAAAGNDGCQCLHVPAATPTVLTVGAMDESGQPLNSSNWGDAYRTTGLLAPGRNIYGALSNQTYGKRTGTSFATPIVSGVAALLLSLQWDVEGTKDPLLIRKILLSTATPCPQDGATACKQFLTGTLNINGALDKLLANSRLTLSIDEDTSIGPPNQAQVQKTSYSSFHNLQKASRMENIHDNLGVVERDSTFQHNTAKLQLSELPELSNSEILTNDSSAVFFETGNSTEISTPKVALSAITPSCGGDSSCGCGGKKEEGAAPAKLQKVYALGTIGYDFVTESRRDSFLQHINDNLNDPRVVINHLEKGHLTEASELIWTLEQEGTPIYAIHPHGAFAKEAYQVLVDFTKGQLKEGVERVSIPGIIAGKVTLLNGQVVPAIVPTIRGMASWSTKALVKALGEKNPAEEALHNFLERVYHEFRNFGVTSQERAINFAATNAFQANSVFQKSIAEGMQLTDIQVSKSPITRPGVDGWDVQLTFFDPQNRYEKAKKMFRYTIDVSDVVPVTIGTVRSWFVY